MGAFFILRVAVPAGCRGQRIFGRHLSLCLFVVYLLVERISLYAPSSPTGTSFP